MVENKKPSFIKRLFKSIGKIFLYAIFWAYFFTGIFFTIDWAKISWYHNVPNENLPFSINFQRSKGDIEDALFIMNHRKRSEYKDSLEIMLPFAPELEPLFYLLFARNYDYIGNEKEAFFWTLMGLFRINYDAQRCMDGRENIKNMRNMIINFSIMPNIKKYLDDQNSDLYIQTMERVLKWDEENPPQNKPDYYCKMIAKGNSEIDADVTPEENWPIYRENIRNSTKLLIENLKSKKENK